MSTVLGTLEFSNQTELERFAKLFARILNPGDAVLLTGEIGAGKSVFARSAISDLLDHPEDIPSPTFTIVQTYDSSIGEIWHCDLYRLTDISETDELGLEDAFKSAITFIEWPEILGAYTPETSIRIAISIDPETQKRTLGFSGLTTAWQDRLNDVKERFHDSD